MLPINTPLCKEQSAVPVVISNLKRFATIRTWTDKNGRVRNDPIHPLTKVRLRHSRPDEWAPLSELLASGGECGAFRVCATDSLTVGPNQSVTNRTGRERYGSDRYVTFSTKDGQPQFT